MSETDDKGKHGDPAHFSLCWRLDGLEGVRVDDGTVSYYAMVEEASNLWTDKCLVCTFPLTDRDRFLKGLDGADADDGYEANYHEMELWTLTYRRSYTRYLNGPDIPPFMEDILGALISSAASSGCGEAGRELQALLDAKEENPDGGYIDFWRHGSKVLMDREMAVFLIDEAKKDGKFGRAEYVVGSVFRMLLRQSGYGDIVDLWDRRFEDRHA